MKFDPTKPVQTRNGCPARIISTDARHPAYPIVALVVDGSGVENTYVFTKDGRYVEAAPRDYFDLVNVPPPATKITCFVNIYKKWADPLVRVGCGRDSFESAQEFADHCRPDGREYLAVGVPVEIIYIEGQGIDE